MENSWPALKRGVEYSSLPTGVGLNVIKFGAFIPEKNWEDNKIHNGSLRGIKVHCKFVSGSPAQYY